MNSQTPLKRKTTQSLVASILIFSMLAGMLSACNMIIVTPIPTEVIDMELTPSQDLPATQELTLVSPTEEATEMPTELPTFTLTPEPTATAETTKDVYEIDLEKLHTKVISYEYLEANLDKYNQVPNPLVDKAAFDKKIDEIRATFDTDRTKREQNVMMTGMGDFGADFVASAYDSPSALRGQPEMVYFVDNGTVYPILILNVGYDWSESTVETMAVILFDGIGPPEGTGVLQSISEGKKIKEISIVEKQNTLLPDFVNKIMGMGLTGKDLGSSFLLGVGQIQTQ